MDDKCASRYSGFHLTCQSHVGRDYVTFDLSFSLIMFDISRYCADLLDEVMPFFLTLVQYTSGLHLDFLLLKNERTVQDWAGTPGLSAAFPAGTTYFLSPPNCRMINADSRTLPYKRYATISSAYNIAFYLLF